jgi:hypothetical protein
MSSMKYKGSAAVRLAPRFCPVCFTVLDSAMNLTGPDAPEPGDFTICIGCRSMLRFGEGMALELSSLEAVPTHSRFEFAKVLRIMKEMPPLPRKKKDITT